MERMLTPTSATLCLVSELERPSNLVLVVCEVCKSFRSLAIRDKHLVRYMGSMALQKLKANTCDLWVPFEFQCRERRRFMNLGDLLQTAVYLHWPPYVAPKHCTQTPHTVPVTKLL